MARPNNRDRILRRSQNGNRQDIDKFQNDEPPTDSNSLYFSTRTLIPLICLLVAFCIGYKGYLETRINTPFDKIKIVQKTGLAVPDRYWGSYRPNVYFGMKTRDPHSLVIGIMWYFPDYIKTIDDIRHWCEQRDYLKGYSWFEHDGRNFGTQKINDSGFHITTSFVKKLRGSYGGDWTSRISFNTTIPSRLGETVSLLVYTAIENETVGSIAPTTDAITGVSGTTNGLGNFNIKLKNISHPFIHESYLYTSCNGLDVIKDTVFNRLEVLPTFHGRLVTFHLEPLHRTSTPNLLVTQITFKIPFEIEISFESGSASRLESLTDKLYTTELDKHKKTFDEKFENVFNLRKNNFSEKEIHFAKAALSNMIGGIGYFYGSSRVLSEHTNSPVPYWKAPLYTAVPSRSFFPRGFLWDEGFHGFLLATWDLDIVLDIISHWFDLMNVEGWIPREQILGAEALRKVPAEFVTQINTNANPPVFFLTLQFIFQNYEEQLIEQASRLETLDRLYTRLVAWFDWFNTTQTGNSPGTYRWRGRDPNITTELNPKTLTSGMDDYPRASHPTDDEIHVDLRCWITVSASTLVSISNLLNKPAKRFANTAAYLKDNILLDHYHWSEKMETYADYGLHSELIILGSTFDVDREYPASRVVYEQPTYRLVDKTFGYNSLFPLMLQILDPNSEKLGKILNKLQNSNLLWTKYGLRSLSRESPLYMKRNTEVDPPYWRGNIWINMNYLVIRALFYYGKIVGPYNKLAEQIYADLRKNVIENIHKEFERTGYLWEHYNDITGQGEGAKPFTGWTSLVVLLMAEMY